MPPPWFSLLIPFLRQFLSVAGLLGLLLELKPSVVVKGSVRILSQVTVGAHRFHEKRLKIRRTNGLAQYDTILGYPLHLTRTVVLLNDQFWLAASFVMLLVCIVVARWVAVGVSAEC